MKAAESIIFMKSEQGLSDEELAEMNDDKICEFIAELEMRADIESGEIS